MGDLSLKTHYSTKELVELNLKGFPSAVKNIIEKAKRENWQSRKREGRGGGLEYAFSSLPIEVQQEILLKTTPQQTAAELQKIEQNRPLASNELWQMWDEASAKAQEQAKIKLAVRGVDSVIDSLKTLGLLRFIRTKEEINKDAMLNEPELAATVAGVTIRKGMEDFVITPFEQEVK